MNKEDSMEAAEDPLPKQASGRVESPYAWDHNDDGAQEIRQFVETVRQAVQPGFTDPLTEETRKIQRLLVLISFGLLLLSMHAITRTPRF